MAVLAKLGVTTVRVNSWKVRLWGVGLTVVQPDGRRGSNCVYDLGSQVGS
jgi:hypothetical protein